MEAKQNKQVNKKLTHEELQQKFGELYVQYQKATEYIQKLENALNEQNFNKTSFCISMLFKVMDHPEQYTQEFVKWTAENIQSAMTELVNALAANPEEEKKEDK